VRSSGEHGLFAKRVIEKDYYLGSYAGVRWSSVFVPASKYQFEANAGKNYFVIRCVMVMKHGSSTL